MFWKKKLIQESDKIPGIEYPKVGEQWIRIANNGDPWGKKELFVEILDVKDNWVRFGRLTNGKYPVPPHWQCDSRFPVEYFFAVYQRYVPLPSEKTEKSK